MEAVAKIMHELAPGLDLFFQRRVVWRECIAIGRFRQKNRLALAQLNACQDFLGQNDTDGGADPGEFERMHRMVPEEKWKQAMAAGGALRASQARDCSRVMTGVMLGPVPAGVKPAFRPAAFRRPAAPFP